MLGVGRLRLEDGVDVMFMIVYVMIYKILIIRFAEMK